MECVNIGQVCGSYSDRTFKKKGETVGSWNVDNFDVLYRCILHRVTDIPPHRVQSHHIIVTVTIFYVTLRSEWEQDL